MTERTTQRITRYALRIAMPPPALVEPATGRCGLRTVAGDHAGDTSTSLIYGDFVQVGAGDRPVRRSQRGAGRLQRGQAPAQQASMTCSSPSNCHNVKPTRPDLGVAAPRSGTVRDRHQGHVMVPARPAATLEVVKHPQPSPLCVDREADDLRTSEPRVTNFRAHAPIRRVGEPWQWPPPRRSPPARCWPEAPARSRRPRARRGAHPRRDRARP
jgi:hypothetical protein